MTEIGKLRLQMEPILNYSENDFPSLGTSARSKSRKRKKRLSCVINENAGGNEITNQFHQSYCEETVGISFPHGKNSEYQQSSGKYKSRKPTPTLSVNINDFLRDSEKPNRRNRVRATKHYKENPVLSGNSLDTDNPVRQKGFMNVPKKAKNLSKIKTAVLEGREEMKNIKDYSAEISIEKKYVLLKSEIPKEYLWKSVVYGKVKTIKNIINFEENNVCNKSDQKLTITDNEEIPDEALIPSSEDKKYNYRISLQKLLHYSGIPPHKILIHHHNFKSYCDNCITEELNRSSNALISQIVRYQYNKYQINPTKAVSNKRYVLGFKQVTKYVKMNKIKLFIIVPDMEDSLSNTVEELKSLGNAYCIPYLFALSRRKLGFLAYKKVGVCCFGILDYSGAEANLNKTLESMTKAKKYYMEKCLKAKSFYETHFSKTSESEQFADDALSEMIETFNENFSLEEALGNQ